jgi:hypothetical protein
VNNRIFAILAMVYILVGCANQRIIYQEYKPEQKIHYSQKKTIEDISNYVFYLDEGDKIPLQLTLDSELVDIDDWKCDLILKQKVYFRLKIPEGMQDINTLQMSENEKQMFLRNILIYLSADAEEWIPYTDISAAAKAFGIKGGSISFGMGITKQDAINIFLNVKTNKR